jgi:hypothetical protein
MKQSQEKDRGEYEMRSVTTGAKHGGPGTLAQRRKEGGKNLGLILNIEGKE